MIDLVNLRQFFIIKILSRRKTRWWKRLFDLNLQIEYRLEAKKLTNDLSRRRNYKKTIKIKNLANRDNCVLFVAYLQEKILECLLLKIQEWALMSLKKLCLIESNAEKSTIKNDAIWNLFDSSTNFKVQSSERFKTLSSIEIRKTFDKMSKKQTYFK